MQRLDQWSGVLTLLAILTIWEVLSRAGVLPPNILPASSDIVTTSASAIVTGDLAEPIITTARQFSVGFLLAIVVGIPCGYALGRWETLRAAFEPLIEFLRPLPVVAILPIALYLLGYGDAMAYSVIAFGAGWIVLLHAMDGIRGVDPVLVDTGRTFGISPLRQFITILVPAAAPMTFTGLRIAAGLALMLTIVVELVTGFGGLGTYIGFAQGTMQIAQNYAGLLFIGLIGFVLAKIFHMIENRLMSWHRGFTGRQG